tara:strand:- start:86834 stop:89326 length:2493 start_codon:yes stop_codon:yes gene_type:complete
MSLRKNKLGKSAMSWYTCAYILVIVSGLILRLIDLDSRAVHYDEAIHLMASFKLMTDGLYEHSAWMHGPLQIETVSIIFKVIGDSLFSGRILYVITGTALICLPLFIAGSIGKPTTLIMAIMLSFSPSLVYMSRFARNDIIMVFLSFLLFILAYKYAYSGKYRFLIYIAAILGLIFSTKETSYFIVATMGTTLFVAILFLTVNKSVNSISSKILLPRLWDLSILTFGLVFPLCTALTGFSQTFIGITLVAAEGSNNPLTGALGTGNPWVNVSELVNNPVTVILPVIICSVITTSILIKTNFLPIFKVFSIFLLIIYTIYAYLIAVLNAPHNNVGISLATSLVIISISVYWIKHIQNPIFKAIFLYSTIIIGIHHLLITSGEILLPYLLQVIFPGTHVFNEFITLSGLLSLTIIVIFYSVSIAVGLWRFSYKWIVTFGVFTVIILVTYTTYFTNSQGFYTGIWQSLGYWMAQQEVARGNQPWYYYFIGLTVYEFLPVIFGVIGIVWSLKTKSLFGSLFSLWAIIALIFFTIASEKMPWLLTYMSVPLILTSAVFLGSLFKQNENRLKTNVTDICLIVSCSFGISLIMLSILSLSQNLLVVILLIILSISLAFIGASIFKHQNNKTYNSAIILPIASILLILTIINTYYLNHRNDDSLKQLMVYAQGSHNLPQYFDDRNAQSNGSLPLTTIDYDIWYPMHWYARHYDIEGSVNFRCFKLHGDPEWNESCVTYNDLNKNQNFLISEIHHPFYKSQANSKSIIGPTRNILWFPEIYRRPGENRSDESLSQELYLDYQYLQESIFKTDFWNSIRNYLFFRKTNQDWFHGDYYLYE